jgi:hypothetical protein
MFTVALYAGIRRAVMVDGLIRREAAKHFGVHRNTITKMLPYSVPPGYQRHEQPGLRKLGPYMTWIDKVLEGDRSVPKERHTAQRIFERLRDEEGFSERLHDCAGVCGAGPAALARDVPSPELSSGACAGGFWPGGRPYRGQEGPLSLFLRGSATPRRLLRQGLSS